MKYEIWKNGVEHSEIWNNGHEYVEAWTLINGEKTLVWKKGNILSNYFAYQSRIVYVDENLTDYKILNLQYDTSIFRWNEYPEVLEFFDNDTWIVSTSSKKYYITTDFENFELIDSSNVQYLQRLSQSSLYNYYCINSNNYLRYYSKNEGIFVYYDKDNKSLSETRISQPFNYLSSVNGSGNGGLAKLPSKTVRLDITIEYEEERYSYIDKDGNTHYYTIRKPNTVYTFTTFGINGIIGKSFYKEKMRTPNKTTSEKDTTGGIGCSIWEAEYGSIYGMYQIGLTDYKIEEYGEYNIKRVVSKGPTHNFVKIDHMTGPSNYFVLDCGDLTTGDDAKVSYSCRLYNSNSGSVIGDVIVNGYMGKHFWLIRNGVPTHFNDSMSNYPIKYQYIGEEEIREISLNDVAMCLSSQYMVPYIENGVRSTKHPRSYIANGVRGIMIFENGLDFDTVNKAIKIY